MKKINIKVFKPYIVWFIMWLCFVSWYSFAAWSNWTIWDLFKKVSGNWFLVWDNIEDETIKSSKIKDGSISASDVWKNAIWWPEIEDDILFTNVYATWSFYMWSDNKKVATEKFVTDKWYITSVPSTYATKNYVINKWYATTTYVDNKFKSYPSYIYKSIKSENLPNAEHSYFAVRRCFDWEEDAPFTAWPTWWDCLRFACKISWYDPNYWICLDWDYEKNNQWWYTNSNWSVHSQNFDSNSNKTIRCKAIECRKMN